MKLSGPIAAGAVAIAVILIVIAGYFYMRHATGADAADEIHAAMKKIPPGQPPFSAAQIEEMKRRNVGGSVQPGGAH